MTTNIKTIGAGRSLFKQGDKGGDLYFIHEGSIELSVRDEKTGHVHVIATLGPKSVLGTMSFLEGEPRSASAMSKSELKVVVISQAQRDRLLKTVPTWLQVLIRDLSKSLRRTNENYISLLAKYDRLRKKYENKTGQKFEDEPNGNAPSPPATAPISPETQQTKTSKSEDEGEPIEPSTTEQGLP